MCCAGAECTKFDSQHWNVHAILAAHSAAPCDSQHSNGLTDQYSPVPWGRPPPAAGAGGAPRRPGPAPPAHRWLSRRLVPRMPLRCRPQR